MLLSRQVMKKTSMQVLDLYVQSVLINFVVKCTDTVEGQQREFIRLVTKTNPLGIPENGNIEQKTITESRQYYELPPVLLQLCGLYDKERKEIMTEYFLDSFLNILLCITVHANFYELCAYVFLSLAGCLFTELLKQEKNRIGILVILPCMEVVTAALFHYLADYTFDRNTILYAAAGGLITDLLILLLFGKIKKYTQNGKTRSLAAIMEEDYPLLAEIRKYSKADYEHAKKVSNLCERCAPSIGADPAVAKAAGFYYRLGKIEGEPPYVENGVLIAQSSCFPREVVDILAEYNGEDALPSTKESALVHMVEALVTRFEILDKNTVSSTWNYEVVIYQTMNETSATGIYDASGLTMNQFLKIREFFVKGENLF